MPRMTQTAIPSTLMRGGTSKGLYFLESDLPADPKVRDRVLLAAMGSPDLRQIDGVGGSDPLTSKVAIVSKSSRPGVDIDYLFAQVSVDKPFVDINPNCGNMLAGVGPFAIEKGLIPARDGKTKVSIYMVNSGNLAVATIDTPGGEVRYDGGTAIAGVPGTAAEIPVDFMDTVGSVCGVLLPTGHVLDKIAGIEVTCIDNGMPVVVLRAKDLGKTGYESPKELENDPEFRRKLEAVRLAAGPLMGLGDVKDKVIPKMTLIAAPRAGGHVSTRTFIPHRCHSAIGVLGAVSVATACILPGGIGEGIAQIPDGPVKLISVEHPTGEFTIEVEVAIEPDGPKVVRSSLQRTARALFEGHVLVPASVWDGKQAQPVSAGGKSKVDAAAE